MANSSRKVPPKFLRGKLIQNDRYSRHDSISIAEDNIVLGVDSKDLGMNDSIINAQEYLKAKKK
tara:strand:+ start:89 stop:280 length:192 start_codon:yes stop_codon:yes gene_type:complete